MSKNLPYPEHLKRGYPPGVIPEKRQIISCRNPKDWYAGMIGKELEVHYFATFGAWTTDGKWVGYYDLSAPIGIKSNISAK